MNSDSLTLSPSGLFKLIDHVLVENDRYPHIKPTSIKQFVSQVGL